MFCLSQGTLCPWLESSPTIPFLDFHVVSSEGLMRLTYFKTQKNCEGVYLFVNYIKIL